MSGVRSVNVLPKVERAGGTEWELYSLFVKNVPKLRISVELMFGLTLSHSRSLSLIESRHLFHVGMPFFISEAS